MIPRSRNSGRLATEGLLPAPLRDAVQESDEYSGRVHRKTRCVRVIYEFDFHVDLVPYLESDGRHYITNRSEPPATGALELSDPERFNEWMFERTQATNGTFVKVIRLIKYLRDFKDTFACKSIILTTLLGGTINPSGEGTDDPAFKDVPTALVTLMTRLADTLPTIYPQILTLAVRATTSLIDTATRGITRTFGLNGRLRGEDAGGT